MIFAVALAASARIAGLAYLHDGVQSLATRADCMAGGAIDTNLTWRRRRPTLDRALASISDVARIRRQLGGTCGGIAIPAAQVLAGGAVIVSPNHTAPLAVLFALDVIMRARLRFGVDGGDEMLRVVTSALLLAALSTAVSVQYAAVTFLAMTSCAAYMAPGWLKLSSRTWWTGRVLDRHRVDLGAGVGASRANACAALRPPRTISCSVVTLWESLFGLGLLAGPRVALAVAASAILFHVGCAVVMGLDGFLVPFVALLPCDVAFADLLCKHVPGPIRLACAFTITAGVALRAGMNPAYCDTAAMHAHRTGSRSRRALWLGVGATTLIWFYRPSGEGVLAALGSSGRRDSVARGGACPIEIALTAEERAELKRRARSYLRRR